jgi:hypothetical protein
MKLPCQGGIAAGAASELHDGVLPAALAILRQGLPDASLCPRGLQKGQESRVLFHLDMLLGLVADEEKTMTAAGRSWSVWWQAAQTSTCHDLHQEEHSALLTQRIVVQNDAVPSVRDMKSCIKHLPLIVSTLMSVG